MTNKRVPITELDNRGPDTTWIWINEHEYVEVNPTELYENMVRNNPYPHSYHWYNVEWGTEENTAKAVKLCETVSEALHQGLDGWSYAEQDTINRFLDDIGKAMEQTED